MTETVVVGLGGIGSCLIPLLAPHIPKRGVVRLVDGDSYEPRNQSRQGHSWGLKAEVQKRALLSLRPDIRVMAVVRYVTEPRDLPLIDGSIVLTGVDNHPARALVARIFGGLRNGVLITGGNGLWEGNVYVWARRDGQDVTLPLLAVHPEIGMDRTPPRAALGCAARGEQTRAANEMAARIMADYYASAIQGLVIEANETYFDARVGLMVQRARRGR